MKAVLLDVIEGKTVERRKIELRLNAVSLVSEFTELLIQSGYRPTTVADVDVRAGMKVPAYLLEESTAYFGWVFWEKFTDNKLRKLWGSSVRNSKGDWELQIGEKKRTTVFANPSKAIEMDIDRPS